jgi:hypothetical protein
MNASFIALLLAAGTLMACRESPPARSPSNRTRIIESSVTALVRPADEAFASTLVPDYDRPFIKKPHDLEWVSGLYLQACRAGDRRSCWRADATYSSKLTEEMVHRNCLAGDLMSCRALRREPWEPDEPSEPDKRLRGWVGRAIQCDGPQDCQKEARQKCQELDCWEALQQECADGFPASCWSPLHRNDEGALARATELAMEGCQAGLRKECQWLLLHISDHAKWVFAYGHLCHWAADCGDLSYYFKGEPIKVREIRERGCQYGRGTEKGIACEAAWRGYLDGTYPEPVPGRGRALVEWSCKQWVEEGFEPDLAACVASKFPAVGAP